MHVLCTTRSVPRSVSYNSLLDAAGATLLRMNLIMYRGNALIATITATFHANREDNTNDKSVEMLSTRCEEVRVSKDVPKNSGKNAMLTA